MPSSGNLAFLNKPVKFNEKYLQQLRKSVVLVNQHPILFSTSVYKNIEFGLKVRKIPRKKRKIIIESALDMVDMKSFINADARHLSGGETRRIAIARAFLRDTKILIMDEPTSVLTPQETVEIFAVPAFHCPIKPVYIIFFVIQASRSNSLIPTLLRVFSSTCFTIIAQFRL